MRLFIAAYMDEASHQEVTAVQDKLKKMAQKATYVKPGQLHMTLFFLGDVDPGHVETLKTILDQVPFESGPLHNAGIEIFSRGKDETYVLTAEGPPHLKASYKEMKSRLDANGFRVEKRPFKAHVTLARKVRITPQDKKAFIDSLKPFSIRIAKIALVRSVQESRGATHEILYEKPVLV